jgi:hypothetical protein
MTVQGVVTVEGAGEVADETASKITSLIQHASTVKVKRAGESAGDLQGAGEIEIQIAVMCQDQSPSDSTLAVQGAEEGAYAVEEGH